MKETLIELGELVVKEAERLSATHSEIYLKSIDKLAINIERGSIRAASRSQDVGCGIRSVIDKKIGYSYTTTIDKNDVLRAVSDSISVAKSSLPDERFVSLPQYSGAYPAVKGLFDPHIAELTAEESADLMVRGVSACKEVSGEQRNLITGLVSSYTSTTVIVNSLGITGHDRKTELTIELSAVIGEGDEQCSSWEEQTSCNLQLIEPEVIGKKAAENALALRGAKTIQGGDMKLILAPLAIEYLFGQGLVPALNAKEVQQGKSYLVDSLGSKISTETLGIHDNALVEGGIGSRSFDGEGSPSKQTTIIDSGILTSYLHDSYSSNHDGVANTSNALRKSYENLPVITRSNLIVLPGKGSLDYFVEDIGKGVLCRFTFDRPNMVTGELSAMVMEGFYIEGGEVQHALKNTLFGTTMQDLLMNTIAVGSDVEKRGSVITPSIVVDSVKVTSG